MNQNTVSNTSITTSLGTFSVPEQPVQDYQKDQANILSNLLFTQIHHDLIKGQDEKALAKIDRLLELWRFGR